MNGLTRRGILGASAAVLAPVTAAAVPAMPVHPDATLLALAGRIEAGGIALANLSEQYENTIGGYPSEYAPWVAATVREGHEMTEELAGMRATTPDGMRAKAAVFMRYAMCGPDWEIKDDDNRWWAGHDELIGWSICRDLLGGSART